MRASIYSVPGVDNGCGRCGRRTTRASCLPQTSVGRRGWLLLSGRAGELVDTGPDTLPRQGEKRPRFRRVGVTCLFDESLFARTALSRCFGLAFAFVVASDLRAPAEGWMAKPEA